jgi:hypothetical protein
VTELGRIKVNIMNRTPMPPELDNLKTWKCWQDGRPLLLFDYSSVMSTSSLVGRISSPRSLSALSDTIYREHSFQPYCFQQPPRMRNFCVIKSRSL